MRPFTSRFAMEVFDRGNARSARLVEFLTLYVQHFSPAHRTKTNELIEFLERPPEDRKIFYFGLTHGDVPCGFSTLMYYPDGPIAIIDHLVIAPNMRGYGAFFSFADLMASFMESKGLAFDHIVAEVMLEERQLAERLTPTILVRLMRIIGFKAAKLNYWAPDPSIAFDRKGCKSVLMLASEPSRDNATPHEMMRIIDIIYLSHYLKWYQRTMSAADYAKYEIAAKGVLAEIREDTFRHDSVVLNGMKNFDLPFLVDPHGKPDFNATAYIALLAVPAIISVAVAFAQEAWVTVVSGIVATAIILLFALHPRLRRPLLKFFRLTE